MDHVLAYLIRTKYLTIEFNSNLIKDDNEKIFLTYSDSSFIDDASTRTSSYGYCFKLFSGIIDFKAIKSKRVITSSTKAELLAISTTVKEFVRWTRFFKELQLDLEMVPKIYCDNR